MLEILMSSMQLELKESTLRMKVNDQPAQDVGFQISWVDVKFEFHNGSVSRFGADEAEKFAFRIPAGAGDVLITLTPREQSMGSRFEFIDTPNTRVTDITDWSTVGPEISFGFYGSQNLVSVPGTAPKSPICRDLFAYCSRLNSPAVTIWDVKHITDMDRMFKGCSVFNQNLNGWITTDLRRAKNVFENCAEFNSPIDRWNMSKVSDISGFFMGCNKFNQDVDAWNLSSVTNISAVFKRCYDFNKTIRNWYVEKVTDLSELFYEARTFDNDLSYMIFRADANRDNYDWFANSWASYYRPKFTG